MNKSSMSLFCNGVTTIDYAYLDETLGVVGNSLIVDLLLDGDTNEEGVIFDFSVAKKKVKKIIDELCDHSLIISKELSCWKQIGELFEIDYMFKAGKIKYIAPLESICVIPGNSTNIKSIESFLNQKILEQMPSNISKVKITLVSEKLEIESSFFTYTHGLKRHFGNCQRLLHGHRNTVNIFINDIRNYELENKFINEKLGNNIHFVFIENIENVVEIKNYEKTENLFYKRCLKTPEVHIKYLAPQGEFELRLPGNMVMILDVESTVENLSIYFSKIVQNMLGSQDRIRVMAFEGINKGAISHLE